VSRTVNSHKAHHQLNLRFFFLSSIFAFAELQKQTFTFFVSACISCSPRDSTRLPINGFSWNLIFFRKYFEKIQFSLKSDNYDKWFTWSTIYIFDTSSWIILRMRYLCVCVCFSDKSCRKKHILFSVTFPKNLAVWDNVEKYGKPKQPKYRSLKAVTAQLKKRHLGLKLRLS
jgi:hypothetical protein